MSLMGIAPRIKRGEPHLVLIFVCLSVKIPEDVLK